MVQLHAPASTASEVARVVVTDHAFDDVALESQTAQALGASFDVHDCRSEDDTVQALRDVAVALVNLAPVTRRALHGMAPGATVIRYGVGYDNVDVAAARELGIAVANTAGYGTAAVADHTASLMLAVLRRLPQFDSAIRDGRWPKAPEFGKIPSFESTTVGLIGTGRIGLALAERLRAFGFTLVAYDPLIDPRVAGSHGVQLVDLDTLLRTSHVVSLHAPLNAETHHILDARAIALLPRGAVVINTARGGLIDTEALVAAVDSEHISGAGLDVFETEPITARSPLLDDHRYILTPHVAYYNEDSVRRLQQLAADELRRALTGAPPLNRVN